MIIVSASARLPLEVVGNSSSPPEAVRDTSLVLFGVRGRREPPLEEGHLLSGKSEQLSVLKVARYVYEPRGNDIRRYLQRNHQNPVRFVGSLTLFLNHVAFWPGVVTLQPFRRKKKKVLKFQE